MPWRRRRARSEQSLGKEKPQLKFSSKEDVELATNAKTGYAEKWDRCREADYKWRETLKFRLSELGHPPPAAYGDTLSGYRPPTLNSVMMGRRSSTQTWAMHIEDLTRVKDEQPKLYPTLRQVMKIDDSIPLKMLVESHTVGTRRRAARRYADGVAADELHGDDTQSLQFTPSPEPTEHSGSKQGSKSCSRVHSAMSSVTGTLDLISNGSKEVSKEAPPGDHVVLRQREGVLGMAGKRMYNPLDNFEDCRSHFDEWMQNRMSKWSRVGEQSLQWV